MTPKGRRLLVPGLTVAILLLILLGLGTWQVYRLQWKTSVLARIAAAEQAQASPLGPDPAPYTKVSVTGRFRYDLATKYGAEVRDTKTGPAMGSYQIVPLERDGTPPILVDRGWVADGGKPDDPDGVVTVSGYIRPSEHPHWFSPVDDLADRHFYTLNTGAIAMSVGLPEPEPFTLVALGPETAAYPAPAQHLPRPPNNHLSYAITWYGLAVALLVIFIVWIRKPSRS